MLYVEGNATARAVGVQQPDPILADKQWAMLKSRNEDQVHLGSMDLQADLCDQHQIPRQPFKAQMESDSWNDAVSPSQIQNVNSTADPQRSLNPAPPRAATVKTVSGTRRILPKVATANAYADGLCLVEQQSFDRRKGEQSCTQCRFNGGKCSRVSDDASQ